MLHFSRLLSALAVVAVAAWAFPARAADIDKYLLDDSDLVVTVNVKQVVASPLFQAKYQKQAQGLMMLPPVPTFLKGSGFDPLRDLDRVVLCMGRSIYAPEGKFEGAAAETAHHAPTPLFILQGRFDPAKLQAKAEELAKTLPQTMKVQVKVEAVGDARLATVSQGPGQEWLVAVLDPTTAVACGARGPVMDAIAKAAGKKKTQLKPEMTKLLDTLDPQKSLEVVALSSMVQGTSVSGSSTNGNRKTEIKYSTLGDAGVEAARVSATVGEGIQVKAVLTGKEAGQTEMLAEKMKQGLKQGIEEITKEAAKEKEWAPLVDALKTVRITAKDKIITMEGHGSGEALIAFFKAWFTLRTVEEAVPRKGEASAPAGSPKS